MGRLDSYQERPGDRGDLVDLLALAVLYSRLCSDEAPFDRKTMRLALDIHQRVSTRSQKPRVHLLAIMLHHLKWCTTSMCLASTPNASHLNAGID